MFTPLFLITSVGWTIIIIAIVIVLAYLGSRIKIVSQATEYIVERLGRYHQTWTAGYNFLLPFVDRIRKTYKSNSLSPVQGGHYEKDNVIDFYCKSCFTCWLQNLY